MNRYVGIGEAAEVLGVSMTTLRRWEADGKLAAEHTAGGHRRYDLAKCQVPDEYILKSKRPLLVGREVLAALVADWKDRSKTC